MVVAAVAKQQQASNNRNSGVDFHESKGCHDMVQKSPVQQLLLDLRAFRSVVQHAAASPVSQTESGTSSQKCQQCSLCTVACCKHKSRPTQSILHAMNAMLDSNLQQLPLCTCESPGAAQKSLVCSQERLAKCGNNSCGALYADGSNPFPTTLFQQRHVHNQWLQCICACLERALLTQWTQQQSMQEQRCAWSHRNL